MAEVIETYEIEVKIEDSKKNLEDLRLEMARVNNEYKKGNLTKEEAKKKTTELKEQIIDEKRNLIELNRELKNEKKATEESIKSKKGLQKTLHLSTEAYNKAGGGIRGMTVAAKQFIKTPLGATIAVITGALALFKNALEKSEKGQRVLAKVTGTVTGALRTLGNTLVDVGKLLKDVFTRNWDALGKDIDNIKNSFSQLGSNVKEGINEELEKLEDKPEKIEKIGKAAKDTAEEIEKLKLENEKLLKQLESDFEDFYLTKDELAKKANQKEYDDTVANLDKLLEAGTINQAKYDEMKTKAHQIQVEKDWMIDEEARQAEIDAEQKKLDEEEKLANEAAEKKRKKREAEEEAEKNAQKALLDASFSATSTTLNAISDLTGKENKKAFEFSKGLEIADATVSTIKGAVGAFAQASSAYSPPYGQIIGGITAGAVTASGLANIAKIKATKYGSGSSSSASTPKTVNINSSLPESTTSKISGMQGDLALSTVTPSVSTSPQDQTRTVLVVDDVTAKQASQSKIAQITSVK